MAGRLKEIFKNVKGYLNEKFRCFYDNTDKWQMKIIETLEKPIFPISAEQFFIYNISRIKLLLSSLCQKSI